MRRIALLTLLPAICVAQSGPQYSLAPDLLTADPVHYTLELENQWVRVIHEHMPPHEGVKLHTHPDPGGVVVSFTYQNLRQFQADGSSRVLTDGRPGRVSWAAGRTHRGDNLMDTDYDYIEVEPKEQKGPQSNVALLPAAPNDYPDPSVSDPGRYHVEFENEFVRVIRVRIAPLDHVAMHRHPSTGAVLILLTDQDARQTFPDGSTRENHYKARTVRWEAPGGGPHADQNLNNAPLEIIRVELKHSR
jgi:hypothetical protein